MKKQVSKAKWERLFPPGFDWENERSLFIGLLSGASAWCLLGFWARIGYALGQLKDSTAVMRPFYEVMGNGLFFFPIFIAIMLAAIIMHYAHHHIGSKSIYLMRRLPQKWELHRRCLSFPLISATVAAFVAVVLFFICYGIYMAVSPEHLRADSQLRLLIENWNIMYWREF